MKLIENDVDLGLTTLSKEFDNGSFTHTIFVMLAQREPSEHELLLFERILILMVDHGSNTNSSMVARTVASAQVPLNNAVSAGLLSIGNMHGGAGKNLVPLLKDFNEDTVKQLIIEKRMPGFGHRHYKMGDPRVKMMVHYMAEIGYKSEHLGLAEKVEDLFEEIKGKRIHLNIDGLLAVLLADWNFNAEHGFSVFMISRITGLVCQSVDARGQGMIRNKE